MQKTVKVSQNRQLSGLQIRQDLFGAEHRFEVDGTPVYLQLPSLASAESHENSDAYRPVEWVGDQPGDPSSTWYEVSNCEDGLFVKWNDEDIELLRKPRSEPKRSSLQNVAHSVIPAIWPTWARTLFWVSQQYQVYSDAEIPTGGTRGGYGLRVVEDEERLNSLGYIIVFDRGEKLTIETWKAMQDAFDRRQTPPLWFNYLFDGYRNMAGGNATGAIISAAIACETAIRGFFWKINPDITHPTAARIIDNVSVQQLLTRWGELTGSSKPEMDKTGKSNIHLLFDRRNSVMHHGANINDLAEVRALLNSAKTFIIDTDRRMSELSSISDSIFEDAPQPGNGEI